jgi:hypothetical protein
MKRTGSIRNLLGVALLLALLAAPATGRANDELAGVDRALAASALQQAEQEELRERAATAVRAGVAPDDVAVILTRSLARGADSAAAGKLVDAGRRAAEAGLPAGPVVSRIEQGLAKGVPLDRIAAAAASLVDRMQEARPIVDGLIAGGMRTAVGEREQAIGSVARTLEKSVPASEVAAIGKAVRGAGGTLGLAARAADAATFFAGSGMAPQTAAALVRHAVERGFTARDLDGMIRQMDAELRRGVSAEDAAARMDRDTMQQDRDRARQDRMQDRGRGAGTGSGGRGR